LAATLSDDPDNADSDSTYSIIGNRQNKIMHPLPRYSDSEQIENESDDDDETLDSVDSTWVNTDKTPNLGPYAGNPGVKQIPSDPTELSQITGIFLETYSLICCVRKESILLIKSGKVC